MKHGQGLGRGDFIRAKAKRANRYNRCGPLCLTPMECKTVCCVLMRSFKTIQRDSVVARADTGRRHGTTELCETHGAPAVSLCL